MFALDALRFQLQFLVPQAHPLSNFTLTQTWLPWDYRFIFNTLPFNLQLSQVTVNSSEITKVETQFLVTTPWPCIIRRRQALYEGMEIAYLSVKVWNTVLSSFKKEGKFSCSYKYKLSTQSYTCCVEISQDYNNSKKLMRRTMLADVGYYVL